jgi:ankyrin repeat protein
LHYACRNSHLELAQWLVDEKGFEVSVADNFGDTPLHKACGSYKAFEICKWLINDKKANINIPNHNGETPISIAVRVVILIYLNG